MKKLFYLTISLILCMALFPASAYATSADELPGESVYASAREQDVIYRIMENSPEFMRSFRHSDDYIIRIVKESITPVYYADIRDFAETGVFELYPWVKLGNYIGKGPMGAKGNMYMAQTITPSGEFAGDLTFAIEDGIAVYLTVNLSRQYIKDLYEKGFVNTDLMTLSTPSASRHDYSVHAKEIQTLLGKSSPVPASEVRLVSVNGLGMVYYLNDGDTEALYGLWPYLGGSGTNNILFGTSSNGLAYIDDSFKRYADTTVDMYNKQVAEYEAWLVEHPGETYIGPTGSGWSLLGLFGNTDTTPPDVLPDWFLGALDYDAGTEALTGALNNNGIHPGIIAGITLAIVAVLVASGAIAYVRIRKRQAYTARHQAYE